MRNRNAVLGFVTCGAFVLVVEAFFAARKVRPIDLEAYASQCVDIEARDGWRFGFWPGMHGALLVKTPDRGQSPRPPHDEHGRKLHALMSRELRQIPLKVALETGFYLGVLGFVFFVAAPLRDLARGSTPGRPRRLAASLLPGALLFCVAAAPLLLLGYGYGGFTNLVGPGAMSYSGPYFHWRSWIQDSSNSISYRAFVSPLLLPPGVLVQTGWLALRKIPIYGPLLDDEPAGAAAYWVAGALVYGTLWALLQRRGSGRARRSI